MLPRPFSHEAPKGACRLCICGPVMGSEIGEVIDKFSELHSQDLDKAVKFVARNPSIPQLVFSCLQSQSSTSVFFQPLFEWLYKCVQLKSTSSELFNFCLQFVPELVVVYLHAVYEDLPQLKANAEVLLLAILSEVEKEKQALIQVPTLSKSSVYHQCPSQLTQPVLTEAVLQLHNEVETVPSHQAFTGKSITVNNRLQFLCTVLSTFCDHIMIFSAEARDIFCQCCIRLALQGMETLGHRLDPFLQVLPKNFKGFVSKKRISVNDGFIVSLLRGIRICLFQSCHNLATKALDALKIRAEYELLTQSIQISHTLSRLIDTIKPQKLDLNVEDHSGYHGAGSPTFSDVPSEIHVSLNSVILQHNLSVAAQSPNASPGSNSRMYGKSTAV